MVRGVDSDPSPTQEAAACALVALASILGGCGRVAWTLELGILSKESLWLLSPGAMASEQGERSV